MTRPLARRTGALFLFFLAAAYVYGSEDGLNISSTISPAFQAVCVEFQTIKLVEATYSEEKVMKILSHSLLSHGTLLFSPERGVYRHMTAPFDQEILMTRERLVQHTAGTAVDVLPVRRQPVAQAFVEVLLAFFSGDQKTWEKYFDATFTGTEHEWKIEFRPRKKSPLAVAIKEMVLEGQDGLLNQMTVIEKNGDLTRTRYTDQHVYRGAEGDEALRRFPLELKAP